MELGLRFCDKCGWFKISNSLICPICGKKLTDTSNLNDITFIKMSEDEKDLYILEHSERGEFDPECYRARKEADQKALDEMHERLNKNIKHCPKCGGTDFTPVRKKFSLLTGFATNKVEMICNKCGTKIK